MTRPRAYDTNNDNFTREELETWINQVEDLSGKSIVVAANIASKMTVLTVDLAVPKPSPARVVMGHIPGAGADPVEGTAFILKQAMDVTIVR
jgi:type IV secretory pathway ATPase VirB11/archaellum biosynthesis ATPase